MQTWMNPFCGNILEYACTRIYMYGIYLERILKKLKKKSNFVILIPFSGKNKYCCKSLKCIYLLKRFQQFNFCSNLIFVILVYILSMFILSILI